MGTRNKVDSGAVFKRRERGQPEVVNLVSNATVIATLVNPETVNQTAGFELCSSMQQLVEKFGPTLRLDVQTEPSAEGGSAAAPQEVVMHYGADDPPNAVVDLTVENLVGKVRLASKAEGRSEIDGRPLLKQRLRALMLADLAKNLEDPEVKSLLAGDRKDLAAWLDSQIQEMQALVTRKQDERAIAEAAEDGHE